jgi:glycosyltransferase involved in cell wall biosynthesis
MTRTPVIMHFHLLSQFASPYAALAVMGACAVVVSSRTSEQWLMSSRWGERLAGRLHVIPNPVDIERFHPAVSGASIRAELNLHDHYPVMALVNALEEWKGQADMLRAMPAILAHFPTARLLLVGADRQADYSTTLQKLIDELKLYSAVKLLGQRPDVPQILAAAHLAILASWRDAYPGAVSEAMASGRAVVATRSGGSEDMVTHGETGLLTPPRSPEALAQAVIALANDRMRLRDMGEKGRARIVSLCSPGAFMARIEALYQACLM